jgi:hypothetical protein
VTRSRRRLNGSLLDRYHISNIPLEGRDGIVLYLGCDGWYCIIIIECYSYIEESYNDDKCLPQAA